MASGKIDSGDGFSYWDADTTELATAPVPHNVPNANDARRAAPPSLTQLQIDSVKGLKARWSDRDVLEQDLVAALDNPDKAEGRYTFLSIHAFLATGGAQGHEETQKYVVAMVLKLAFDRPRLELFEWLDTVGVLYNIEDLAARVTACKHQVVHLWFYRNRLDAKLDERFAEPVDTTRRETGPIDDLMKPWKQPVKLNVRDVETRRAPTVTVQEVDSLDVDDDDKK